MIAAIEYIRQQQQHERQLVTDVQRLQSEREYAREAVKENDLLKTEVQVMHQALKRLNPGDNHVYGQFTQQLQHQNQPNGSNGLNLPPINPPGSRHESSGFGGAGGPPAAMQGVEYGNYGLAR